MAYSIVNVFSSQLMWKLKVKLGKPAVWENLGRCTCCLQITTLCQLQCGVREECTVLSAF